MSATHEGDGREEGWVRWWRPVLATALVVLALLSMGAGRAGGQASRPPEASAQEASAQEVSDQSAAAPASGMSLGQAAVLGVVEGVTEYLPVSSTGHLLVTQRLMDIGTTEADKEAADAYAIVIQLGAILAIVILYWRRLLSLLAGLVGRDPEGRRVLIALVVAAIPAGVVGLVGERAIKDVLFGAWPVVVAWFVGGVALLVLVRTGLLPHGDPDDDTVDPAGPGPVGRRVGASLGDIAPVQALVIGAAQILALWPGTSRSLVTIVAAVLIGLRLRAAVEFSFLLGLGTLTAATVLDLAKHGELIVDTFGAGSLVVGFICALVSAVVAVRWMVTYLQRHSLAIFGWYRIAVAVLVAGLLVGGVMTSGA